MSDKVATAVDVRVNERVEVDVFRGSAPEFKDLADDVNRLLREHGAYQHIRASHCWELEKQCSVCQRPWEPEDLGYEDDPAGTMRCAHCGALIAAG